MENLNASSRAKTGKGNNRRLRSSGDMPAVIYGGAGEATSLSIASAELTRLLRSAHRRNTLIGLTIDGAAAEPVLVRELQADPITRDLIHADFIRVDLKAKIIVKVPVEMTGRAVGVLTGGRMRLVRRVVDVSCLPEVIPSSFPVDVTELDGDDSLRFSECPIADGLEKVFTNDFVVVQCVKGRAARQEDEDDVVVGAVAAAPVAEA
jgi:large subunit ribosomal protein L25